MDQFILFVRENAPILVPLLGMLAFELLQKARLRIDQWTPGRKFWLFCVFSLASSIGLALYEALPGLTLGEFWGLLGKAVMTWITTQFLKMIQKKYNLGQLSINFLPR